MSENNNNNNQTPDKPQDDSCTVNVQNLSDERRIKVLSPSMLVMKRFIRNKLAITGLIILVVMFLFSFLGGVLISYRQDQVFTKQEFIPKEYAAALYNTELRTTNAPGEDFDKAAFAQLILAINKGESTFTSNDESYFYTKENDYYLISRIEIVATVMARKLLYSYTPAEGATLSDELKAAYEAAVKAGEDNFTFAGVQYIAGQGNNAFIGVPVESAIASLNVFDSASADAHALVSSYAFHLAVERAIAAEETSFTLDGSTYTVEAETPSHRILQGDRTVALASSMIVNPYIASNFLSLDFKEAIRAAVYNNQTKFTYPNADGEEITYTITLVNYTYNIKTLTIAQLLDSYAFPTEAHVLGTDNNGMDVLTRLMYGGRISLMVGFVVIFFELIIGVVIGGIAGYFGTWVDTLLMRFIDLFNAIPYWPIMVITGAVLDANKVDAISRIMILMLILGLMGWTGIARIVRGQILTLREQDFMVAAEATGISVRRRIFKHLVPNVMPLLIVNATMGLGGIIITEAVLSFLGLGIKYPMASWGSIINAASDVYVMTNFWFIWIPAGILILLTVLGFNFVGDGLRDAFDPRMKR
ncbi:MAG: ABC transporter permease [Firmicutes bacterium]|nr:ABC transporter permease [Bacillota bacterium]